ncbi:hypothetical protein CDD83_10659 [Cordyceps sp. RAO-2017]|nr:hypothetical protein CDD83_10659 [Cordyceps sp. RAO-2017]
MAERSSGLPRIDDTSAEGCGFCLTTESVVEHGMMMAGEEHGILAPKRTELARRRGRQAAAAQALKASRNLSSGPGHAALGPSLRSCPERGSSQHR